MSETLISLFEPPEGYYGDFGVFCSMTADAGMLKEIRKRFLAPKGRPVLAAFIDPSQQAVTDINGLAWMWMQQKGYNIQHAKVAILGFRTPDGAGYRLRLVVSTGNWSPSNSIDLFTSFDLDTAVADRHPQECADLIAAWGLFSWLRERADCRLIEREYDGARPDARLRKALASLPKSNLTPRFIDNRRSALSAQVLDRFATGIKGKTPNCLVMGSGYFEAEPGQDCGVPGRFYDALYAKRLITKSAECHIFLNPLACQGLAGQRAATLVDDGWELWEPFSHRHGKSGHLHAKFILLCSATDPIRGMLYLGSGNLSRQGFERKASAEGNLEAGMVFDLGDNLRWSHKAAQEHQISTFLPLQFETPADPSEMSEGAAFPEAEASQDPPPVAWLEWTQAPGAQEGVLTAPGGLKLAVGDEGKHTPCRMPGPAPEIMLLENGRWCVPVIADGALVSPKPEPLGIDDILLAMRSFPMPLPDDDEEEDEEAQGSGTNENNPLDDPRNPPKPDHKAVAAKYTVRDMMRLLVPLTQHQAGLDRRDWRAWCRGLRETLTHLKPEERQMITLFIEARANPLPILLDPQFRPKNVDVTHLEAALEHVAKSWGLEGFPSLWETWE